MNGEGRGTTSSVPITEARRPLPPAVAVLLCTFNGEAFLAEQLDSLVAQTHRGWSLWISDDGSSDGTLGIAERYRRRLGSDKVHIVEGPRRGFANNFLSLICRPEVQAHHYALCDQDDAWHATKLSRAVAWLRSVPDDTPALYCGRTELIDEKGNSIGSSPLFNKKPDFANALVQSIAGGNTMVFNQRARELVMLAGPEVEIVSHDWWLYMLVTACGGVVKYDATPTVRYRQHGRNQVGSNRGTAAILSRAVEVMRGRYRKWNDVNIAALEKVIDRLTPENRILLERFARARQTWIIPRCAGILLCGVYRQSSGAVTLGLASVLGKI